MRARYLASSLEGSSVTSQTKWYHGAVVKVHGDGSCDVAYEDGDTERNVQRQWVRLLDPLLAVVLSQHPKADVALLKQRMVCVHHWENLALVLGFKARRPAVFWSVHCASGRAFGVWSAFEVAF